MMPLGTFDVGITAQAGQSGIEEEILLDEETDVPVLQTQAAASRQTDAGIAIEGMEEVTEPSGLGPNEEELRSLLQNNAKAEAELSVVSSDDSVCQLKVSWTVKDTANTPIQLALALPEDVYHVCQQERLLQKENGRERLQTGKELFYSSLQTFLTHHSGCLGVNSKKTEFVPSY